MFTSISENSRQYRIAHRHRVMISGNPEHESELKIGKSNPKYWTATIGRINTVVTIVMHFSLRRMIRDIFQTMDCATKLSALRLNLSSGLMSGCVTIDQTVRRPNRLLVAYSYYSNRTLPTFSAAENDLLADNTSIWLSKLTHI